MMKKRILILTDFSSNAYNAIKYAMELYKRNSVEFFILHAYYHSGFSKENLLVPEPNEEVLKKIAETSNKNMEKLKVQMSSFEANDNHEFQYLLEFGPYFEIVKKTVKQLEINLIVMGTQGKTNNKSVILGSNAVNTMEQIQDCPVFAIPANVTYIAPNEIVFPTSYRTQYNEKELATLEEISRITNSPIRILHIQNNKSLSEAQEKNKELLAHILQPAVFTHHLLFEMDVQDGVRSFVQSRNSEMIAFVNKKHNFFGSIFSNPMVKELGKHSKVPLLAMHDVRN